MIQNFAIVGNKNSLADVHFSKTRIGLVEFFSKFMPCFAFTDFEALDTDFGHIVGLNGGRDNYYHQDHYGEDFSRHCDENLSKFYF